MSKVYFKKVTTYFSHNLRLKYYFFYYIYEFVNNFGIAKFEFKATALYFLRKFGKKVSGNYVFQYR